MTELNETVDLFATGEEEDPDCQISGCDRPGTVPWKIREHGTDEPPVQHLVCQFHHRLILGVKITVAVLVIAIFLVAYFSV
jgi:hypothetical protein